MSSAPIKKSTPTSSSSAALLPLDPPINFKELNERMNRLDNSIKKTFIQHTEMKIQVEKLHMAITRAMVRVDVMHMRLDTLEEAFKKLKRDMDEMVRRWGWKEDGEGGYVRGGGGGGGGGGM